MLKLLSSIQKCIDKLICSDDIELLEREGATPQGKLIIDELNRVYTKTGLTEKIVHSIGEEARRIHQRTGKTVRILELGMRNGTQLKILDHFGKMEGIPLELHGVEFRQNIVDLAREYLSGVNPNIYCHYDDSDDLQSFKENDFDIVYSAFVLHHRSYKEMKILLLASLKISRYSVFHMDLSRSMFGIIVLWIYYTVFGYWKSRHDAILSCRRAYRHKEISDVLHELELDQYVSIKKLFPFYWRMYRPFINSDIQDTK